MAELDDDDEQKKKYFRIHIQSLYEQNYCDNKENKEKLKAALTACKTENKRMTAYCDSLINALDNAANSDEFQEQIKDLTKRPHLTYRRKLADFFQEKTPEIAFDIEVQALEEWVYDK